MELGINEEYFGKLLPYVREEKITDITWNGRTLWIDHLDKGRYKEDITLDHKFIDIFATRISNAVNCSFNASAPLLEAETDALRISIIDDSVTNTDKSIAIRKTPAVRRLSEEKMIKEHYAGEELILFLESCVKAHCSIIVTGDVGSGKTELVKFLTKYIPSFERTISIEDNYELRLSSINPDLDCVEIKVSSRFDYTKAIKGALRQLCKWLLLSEARSVEIMSLLEAASTGCSIMTTIHSDDVRKLPDRVVNMMGSMGAEKKNDIYNFFDLAIKVNIDKGEGEIKRSISQVAIFDRDNGENNLVLIYDEYKFTETVLPENIKRKFKYAKVGNPLERKEVSFENK